MQLHGLLVQQQQQQNQLLLALLAKKLNCYLERCINFYTFICTKNTVLKNIEEFF